MPYICLRRTDIPDGTLQVLDLSPNESQRNLIYDPPGQTKYIDRVQNDTVSVTASLTAGTYKGLAAYLLDNVKSATTNAGHHLTAAHANTMANNIITNLLDAGIACDAAAINAQLGAVDAATVITTVGSVADVLKILAGAEYVLPVGSGASTAAWTAPAGSFTTSKYRPTYDTGAFEISVGVGVLSKLKASTFSYGDVTGGAVTVYSDTGAVL